MHWWWVEISGDRSKTMEGIPQLVLFDGVCHFCNEWVQFVVDRDPEGRVHFAPLQGTTAGPILRRHGLDGSPLGSVVLVEGVGTEAERVWVRSDAALRVMEGLGGVWGCAGALAGVPRGLRDAVYETIAANRYRWFGRDEVCRVPSREVASRFLP